jgi:hypothetical protein
LTAQPPSNSSLATPAADPPDLTESISFRLSPLIRLTLLFLYIALTLPLPFLPQTGSTPQVPPILLWFGIGLGFLALLGALSERVVLDTEAIRVTYPVWVPHRLRPGWVLPWEHIQALKPRSTGQGGLVYYFVSTAGEAFLLPMRVAGFARLVAIVQTKTGIDTTDVRPLSQPWMYLILLGFTLLLLLVDTWTAWTALHPPVI